MATFRLTIDCDNAAFDVPGVELARLLRHHAKLVESTLHDRTDSDAAPIRDVNGNQVGSWQFDGDAA